MDNTPIYWSKWLELFYEKVKNKDIIPENEIKSDKTAVIVEREVENRRFTDIVAKYYTNFNNTRRDIIENNDIKSLEIDFQKTSHYIETFGKKSQILDKQFNKFKSSNIGIDSQIISNIQNDISDKFSIFKIKKDNMLDLLSILINKYSYIQNDIEYKFNTDLIVDYMNKLDIQCPCLESLTEKVLDVNNIINLDLHLTLFHLIVDFISKFEVDIMDTYTILRFFRNFTEKLPSDISIVPQNIIYYGGKTHSENITNKLVDIFGFKKTTYYSQVSNNNTIDYPRCLKIDDFTTRGLFFN